MRHGALATFLRAGRPRANPPDPLDGPLGDLRAALADFPVGADGGRRIVGAGGEERWLTPFEQAEDLWRERAREVGAERAARELADWAAEVRAGAGPARERAARARAERAAAAAWEAQAYRAPYPPPRDVNRAFEGRLVWLYHGTATSKLDAILADGVRRDAPKRVDSAANRGRVFLTSHEGGALHSGGMPGATMYAERAARRFGGEPVVLRVIVPWAWVAPDEDDWDLSCADIQWECGRTLPPAVVMEADGRRLRGPLGEGDEGWRAGHVGPRDVSVRRR